MQLKVLFMQIMAISFCREAHIDTILQFTRYGLQGFNQGDRGRARSTGAAGAVGFRSMELKDYTIWYFQTRITQYSRLMGPICDAFK